ncbi:MAG: hypothetical protein ACREQZ_10165 [Woeseiaceae bacterium]
MFASLTNGFERRKQLDDLRWPWLALATVGATSDRAQTDEPGFGHVQRSCRELYSSGDLSDQTLSEWLRKWPASAEVFPTLRDTREIRVSAFQQFVQEVLKARTNMTNTREMSFLVGYIASRLAPGSLEYFRLLRPVDEIIPGVLVWYGVAAALHGDDFIATSGGLGRRLERELAAPRTFPLPPRADMSVWDLEVFSRSDQQNSPLAMLAGGPIQVELLPDVVCIALPRMAASVIRPPTVGGATSAAGTAQSAIVTERRTELPQAALVELGDLLGELNQALSRVANIQYKIGRLGESLELPRSNRGRARRS